MPLFLYSICCRLTYNEYCDEDEFRLYPFCFFDLFYSMEEPWLLVRSVVTLPKLLYSLQNLEFCVDNLVVKGFVYLFGHLFYPRLARRVISIKQEKRFFYVNWSLNVHAVEEKVEIHWRSRTKWTGVRRTECCGLESYMLIFGQW